MCGIAGAMFWDDTPTDRAREVVQAMTAALAHRGPDGAGVEVCAERGRGDAPATVVLGHRRLAIIDLSRRGAQPMRFGAHAVSFNGEFYNFADVRADLAGSGHRFDSASDTEVILHAFDAWGLDAVERMRGMFAFALWDGHRHTLHLVRDRLGIKPLYLWQSDRALLFASEIRALLASGLVPRRLNRRAIDRFLAYQTVPTPETLVQGVRMLEPAATLSVRTPDVARSRTYWDLLPSEREPDAVTPADARARVHDLLQQSARLHLVSDVPVALFLSGGIDSSALAALVRQLDIVPRTVSISFPGTPYDEGPIAREVAAALGTDHVDVPLSEADLLEQLPEALAAVDHPSGDGINTFVVSRAVRALDIKVAWSGLGGDEFFGGYPSFARMSEIASWRKVWKFSPTAMRSLAATAVRSASASIAAEKTAALLESDGSIAEAHPVMRQLFPASQRQALLGRTLSQEAVEAGDPYVDRLRAACDRAGRTSLMSLVSFAEAGSYMHDVLLRDTDQMSMRHGLEVRVPLLDHRLVEALMRLPDAVKQPAGGRSKPLLVDSLGSALPRACTDRPKRGFLLPFEPWMRGELREFCASRLGTDGLAGRGIVNGDVVAGLWQSFLQHEKRTTWSRLWALVALDAWLEATGVSA